MEEQLNPLAETLKKQGEETWKRPKQHAYPSKVHQKNGMTVQEA